MAESSKDYGKLFQKNFHRTVEKMMHTIGKADKTVDDDIERLIAVFNEQHNTANRLQKELQKYMAQAKAMSAVSFGMYQAISAAYEPGWEDTNTFQQKSDSLGQTVWTDLLSQMEEQVVQPLANYLNQFSEMKNKIAKRGRKLMDYDIARHKAHELENAKKRDEFKCTKAHDDLIAAKTVYETMNEELHRELPALYEGRVDALCTWFEAMFSTEKVFANQCSETKNLMADLARRTKSVASEKSRAQSTNSHGSPDSRTAQRKSAADEVFRFPACTAMNNIGDRNSKQQNEYAEVPFNSKNQEREIAANSRLSTGYVNGDDVEKSKQREVHGTSFSSSDSYGSNVPQNTESKTIELSNTSGTRTSSGANIPEYSTVSKETAVRTSDVEFKPSNVLKSAWMEESESSFIGQSDFTAVEKNVVKTNGTSVASGSVLYKAVATNSYIADDVEELTFDAGDIIDVIQPSAEEDMDEGWLLGLNTSNGKRGLFPSNFTRKI